MIFQFVLVLTDIEVQIYLWRTPEFLYYKIQKNAQARQKEKKEKHVESLYELKVPVK